MRTCRVCSLTRLEEEFRGLRLVCKKCIYQQAKDRQKAWKEDHQSEVNLYQEVYRTEHKEQMDSYKKEWYRKNREEILGIRKEYTKTEEGRLARIRASKRFAENNKEQRSAYRKVWWAVKTGKLIKLPCEMERLGWNCQGKIEAHHWDHSKPLDVIWLCKKHHAIADNIKRLMDSKESTTT